MAQKGNNGTIKLFGLAEAVDLPTGLNGMDFTRLLSTVFIKIIIKQFYDLIT